jgi:PAS domain S-box-containing protein
MQRFTSEFLNSVPIGICAFNADGTLLTANAETAALLGIPVESGAREEEMLAGFRLYEPSGMLIAPDDYPIAVALRERRNIQDREIIIERPDGRKMIFLLSARLIRQSTGDYKGLIATVRDITAWRNSENAYRESEARYERAARAGKVGVWDYDVRTDELFISPLLRELVGYDEVELPNSMDAWCNLVHPDDVDAMVANTEARLADGSIDYEIECRRLHKCGEYRDFRVRGTIIRDSDGTPLRITGSDTDITEQKRADEELREAARRKDEFLAMLAHELRNPLAAISNATQLLMMPDMEDLAGWSREVIERQVGQLTRLIDDLLDVSRITRGKIELRIDTLAPAAVVRRAIDAVRPQMEEQRHAIVVDIAPDLPMIEGDPTRLEQVLVNLLTNAAKYTPQGGRVEVRVARDGDGVLFSVKDNGMGIAEDVLPKVFDLFAQDKRSLDRSLGGLGIGLTIVDRIVAMHGGSVAAESDGPGRGSTFMVRLPASARAAAEHSGPSAPVEMRPRHVLIVDDNLDNAAGMAVLLKRAGHHVDTAHEGGGAVALIAELQPEVVLLDIGLPGLDGYEIARRVRATFGVQPLLIAVSGYAQEEDRRRSTEAGFDHHLAKPVNMAELMTLIARGTAGDPVRPPAWPQPAREGASTDVS